METTMYDSIANELFQKVEIMSMYSEEIFFIFIIVIGAIIAMVLVGYCINNIINYIYEREKGITPEAIMIVLFSFLYSLGTIDALIPIGLITFFGLGIRVLRSVKNCSYIFYV